MPLRDHFHPPVKHRLGWNTLYSGWTTNLADVLNETWLPPEFVALERTRRGGRPGVDVMSDEPAPPQAARTMPGVFPDDFEVCVFDTDGPKYFVAAIELITPGTKDRPEERRAFAAKCVAYLQQGVSLVIVDVVTDGGPNLHNEILRVMGVGDEYQMPAENTLYAVAYRPVLRNEKPEIDLWLAPFAVGDELPTMPLRLTGDLFVPVELEVTYTETCRKRRLT